VAFLELLPAAQSDAGNNLFLVPVIFVIEQ
jgi:hypothetical protein